MYKVKAVYDYSSPHDDDLSFTIGQIITVTEEEDQDWYVGEYTPAAAQPGITIPAIGAAPSRASTPDTRDPTTRGRARA